MSLASEIQHLSLLRRNKQLENETHHIYKACVSVANNGAALTEESNLTYVEKMLLNIRRKLCFGNFSEAEEGLTLLEQIELSYFFEGERLFLIGQLSHRLGNQEKASDYMKKAAAQYELAGELHRELRARTNGAICVATLESLLIGELSSYEQEARRNNFSDIIANICRTRAFELLRASRPKEAFGQAMEASSLYLLDGYQDDRAITLLLAAIIQLLLGDTNKALECRSLVLVTEGKVSLYLQVYEAILHGKKPKIPQGHPLDSINWKEMVIKTESIPGKIISALQKNPHTKDELIIAVWGDNALSESYCSRLYSAINSMRKAKGIEIKFNGEKYQLV